MDLPTLERSISNLETSLDSLEFWLTFATGLVVLGLVLEYWHEIPESIAALKQSWSWKPLCVIAGGILITLGVAGELGVQYKASIVENKLRSESHAIEALLNKEAGEARQIAESERLERVKLEAIVAPRSLSLDQQRLIVSICTRFQGHNVSVNSYGMDGEGAVLGGQIIAVLRSAGITVADARASTVVTGGFELGIHVRGPSAEREFVSALGSALSSIGKLRVAINDPPPKSGSEIGGGGQVFNPGVAFVTVMIGIKPVPLLAAK